MQFVESFAKIFLFQSVCWRVVMAVVSRPAPSATTHRPARHRLGLLVLVVLPTSLHLHLDLAWPDSTTAHCCYI